MHAGDYISVGLLLKHMGVMLFSLKRRKTGTNFSTVRLVPT